MNGRRHSLFGYAVLSLVFLAWVAPLAAQEEVAAQEADGEALSADDEVFFETVDVNLVNIDVWVTDKKGNSITGLTIDDFEIYEDKRPVKITNFFAVEEGLPVTPVEVPLAETEEEAPVPPPLRLEKESPLPEDQRLHLVVYVDNFNIRPFNRNRVFRRIREFLNDKLTTDDRVMLASYDRSLKIRHPFTTDPRLIASSLFELETVSGFGLHADSERRDLMRAIEEADNIGEVVWRVRQHAESVHNDLSFTVDAIKELMSTLSGLAGRKAFLYVSDGLPIRPGEDLYYAMYHKFQESSVLTQSHEQDMSRRFGQLAAHANASNITFYAIDAGGLRVATAATAEVESPGTPGLTGLVDSVYISNIQAPLHILAEQTGGQVIKNTNDVGPGLAKISRDFRTYYSLGYVPSHSGSGRYYKVEVKVKGRKGLRVRHREGYRDKPLVARMEDGARSSLMYGFEQNPMKIALKLGAGNQADRGQYDVPFAVAIPLNQVVLIPREEHHEARVKLYFGAMDEDGNFSPVQELRETIRIPNEEMEIAQTKSWIYQDRLRMRSGGQRIAVGVWDEMGATGSFVTQTVQVGTR